MTRSPHRFSPPAKGLLAAFIVLYFGAALLSFAWMLFIAPFMYRMWLESFNSDWVENDNKGWWNRYVRAERRLGRMEHKIYVWIKTCGGMRWQKPNWRQATDVTNEDVEAPSSCSSRPR
jgi:hypothetical protein